MPGSGISTRTRRRRSTRGRSATTCRRRVMLQVPVTLDDYHRWLGELYARCRELEKALAARPGRPAADPSPVRDAANVLAQRDNTNAQAFYLYNTFTNASNYERLELSWNAAANTGGGRAGGG